MVRYRNHSALLLWGLGNEMEGYGKGDNAAIWSAVNDLALLVKELDPHHPTMTVVAEIAGDRVSSIHRLCPAIDVAGINSYGGASSLAQRYRDAGGTKPYILTEFGPPGFWEVAKTPWGRGDRAQQHREGALIPQGLSEGCPRREGPVSGVVRVSLGPQAGRDCDLVRHAAS